MDEKYSREAPLLAKATAAVQEGEGKNNLSTINGCYVPCLLNILGAVLYLRIGFSIGMMGWLGTIGIFAFSEGIAYLTISSFSAIVTNGRMKGGGAYYMISRNLGPAFGGSSGLLFWFTYCINVTFNTVAWTDTFMTTFFPDSYTKWNGIGCSTATLFVLFLIAYKGAGTFAKVNVVIFVCLVTSLFVGIGSIFFRGNQTLIDFDGPDFSTYAAATAAKQLDEYCLPHALPGCGKVVEKAGSYHYTYHQKLYAVSVQRMHENMWPKPVESDQCANGVCNLNLVFSVIFPAVVGMMEGANLSGDLKDPAFSIPWGTIAAVSTAFFAYVLLIIGQAASMDRHAMQINMFVMQDACVSQYLVVLGVAAACLSTALGSMFGSARILQALARDDILPILDYFKVSSRLQVH
jgi:amino acid transporter